ncbi:collagen alpha-2(I) chain-like [Phoenix dactylifera]|uniref:Collagen alpha-2(I) chain-like n=1 Tax=Phoenix dactylifera TaxID=42345 RepID=A0A8B9AVS4_PHODC|nr:collagen alpha-2(I) chain-like [Phoenix dactylifera]
MGTETVEEACGLGKSAAAKKATENSGQEAGKGDGAGGEEPVYGPWLVTNRIGFRRAPVTKNRRKEVSEARAGNSVPTSPHLGPSGKGDGLSSPPSSSSPVDLEGWQKPTKVARRRTPEKDVSLGVSTGGPSQPVTESGLGAELGECPVGRANDLGQAAGGSNTGSGQGVGGPGPSPSKRARSPPRIKGCAMGGPSNPGGGSVSSVEKLGRSGAGFRRRSKSSPPPLVTERGRPPRREAVHRAGSFGPLLSGRAEKAGRRAAFVPFAAAETVAVGLSGTGADRVVECCNAAVRGGKVGGVAEEGAAGGESSKQRACQVNQALLQHMAREHSGVASEMGLRKMVTGESSYPRPVGGVNTEERGELTGGLVASMCANGDSACHLAQPGEGGDLHRMVAQLKAAAKGVVSAGLESGRASEEVVFHDCSPGTGGSDGLRGDQ